MPILGPAAAGDPGLVAVFDGMGGAGGTVYQTPTGPRSGAYLAARVARDAARRRIADLAAPDMLLDGPTAAARSAPIDPGGARRPPRPAARTTEPAAIKTVAGLADHHGACRRAPPRGCR